MLVHGCSIWAFSCSDGTRWQGALSVRINTCCLLWHSQPPDAGESWQHGLTKPILGSNNLSSKAILNISALREHQINVYALTYNCSTVFLKGLSWWVQNRSSNLTCAKETPSYTFLKKHLHLMEWVRNINTL